MPGMTHLGKYLIRRELGKGSMGVVYEGFDPVLQRRVAIKTILPAQLVRGEAADVLARFKREAQAAGRLNHPGIVGVYDYGEAVAADDLSRPDGDTSQSVAGQRVAFIAMEFVEGRELKEHFDANECFSLVEVARIMGEILDALDHSHGKGVTHRDIKPSNLIMLTNGRVKIADFGIARTETSELTQAGAVLGTPAYMSPEQFQGMRVDLRSDIFACGVVLYQFLTGEKPFTGHPTTIMYKVLREEPLQPSALNVSLSAAWDAVLTKALAKHPDDRFQSAGEFAAAIHEALALHPSGFGQSQPQSISAALQVDEDVTRTDPEAAPAAAAAPPVARRDETGSKTSSKPGLPAIPAGKAQQPLRAGVLWGGMGLLTLLVAVGVYLRPADNENGNGAPVSDQAKVPLVTPPLAAEVSGPPVQAPPSTASPAKTEAPLPAPQPDPAPKPAPAITVEPPVASAPTPRVAPAPVIAVPAPLVKAPATSKPPAASIAPPSALALPAPRPAMPRPNPEQPATRSPRCALILEKAGLDEPISPDDRAFLKSSCR